MLEFLDALMKDIDSYKSIEKKTNVFQAISDIYYRENMHSDIIAYYLTNKIPKKCLIEWINKEKDLDINFNSYSNGEIIREQFRIDILIYSNDKKRAIIIENKSNGADDQDKQLPRYFELLTGEGIIVECILYLNKNHIKEPDISGWTKEEEHSIKKILLPTQLVGINSFSNNVVNKTIQESTDVRLIGLSHEIKSLFNNLVYGGINMEDLSAFVKELNKDGNFDKLKTAVKAYNDLPEYLRDYYKEYLDREKENGNINKKYRIGTYKETCLYVDQIFIDNVEYGFDIWFSQNYIDFSFLTRDYDNYDFEKVKEKMGKQWAFGNKIPDDRYRFEYEDILNEKEVKQLILKIINSFSNFI